MSIGKQLAGVNKARDRWSPTLFIILRAPSEYALEHSGGPGQGDWKGPAVELPGQPNATDNASIHYSVTFEFDTADAKAALKKNSTHNWPEFENGTAAVPHIVGGRKVGTIASRWSLSRSNFSSDDAETEGGLAIPMCGAFVVPRYTADVPTSDAYRAKGTIGGKEWNRSQALAAIEGTRLEGPLPIGGVVAKAAGRTVRGTVQDCHRHPVPSAAVSLQTKSRGTWRTVRSGRASRSGTFLLTASGAGTYRVTAGAKASAPVRVR
jgi:hypothetical protein